MWSIDQKIYITNCQSINHINEFKMADVKTEVCLGKVRWMRMRPGELAVVQTTRFFHFRDRDKLRIEIN